MIYNQFSTFIGRHKIIALFKQLYQRDPNQQGQLLPILLLLAPAGGGTNTLINLLIRRCEAALPYARIDFSKMNASTTLNDILQNLSHQLGQSGNGKTRRLRFPRYHLGLSVVSDVLSDNNVDRLHNDIRKLVVRSSFSERIDDMITATSNQWFVAAFLLIIFKWILPIILRLIPDSSVKWYNAHKAQLNMSPTADEIEVLMRLRLWSRPDSSREQLLIVEQLLLEAFLEDLREAFNPKKRSDAHERTTYIALFFKNYDRILPDESIELFLSTIIKQRSEGKTDPLLLVIASHQRLFDVSNPAQNPLPQQEDELITETEAEAYAHTLYEHWQKQVIHEKYHVESKMYLPLWLQDFGPDSASSLLRMIDKGQTGLFENATLIHTLQRITHGHPLALSLAAEVFQKAKSQGQNLVPDKFFQETLPLDFDQEFDHADHTIGNYLLHRFLYQLSEHEQEQLLFCVAPRTLSVNALRITLALDSDNEAQKLWDRYRRCTFTQSTDSENHHFSFHPLLRDLLMQRLVATSTARKHYYKAIHTNLLEYYTDLAREGNSQAQHEAVYHALALGKVEPAIAYVRTAIENKDDSWKPLLEDVVAQAPATFMPPKIYEYANAALYRVKVSCQAHDIATSLVLHVWLSRTSGIDAKQYATVLYNLAETYRYLSYQEQLLSQNAIDHYLELARISETIPQAKVGEITPYTPDLTPFPTRTVSKFWPRTRIVAVLFLLVALLVSYPAVYYHSYGNTYCNPVGITSVPTVLHSLYFANGISTTHAPDGECVGISDGTFAFDTTTNSKSGSYKTQAAEALMTGDTEQAKALWTQANLTDTSDAEALIYQEDQHVLDLSASQHFPYVTVVILTMLTARDVDQKSIATGRDDLQGAYIAQIEHNKDFRLPLLRLLIANAGGNSAYAPEVAHQIVQAVHADPSIVGVMGPSQSRDETIRAIKILAAAHIPVVSSTASSDALTNISPYFFRISPPNKYQVSMGVSYAEKVLHAKTAVLFEALNDNYSQSLASDFVEQFVQRDHHTLVQTESYNASDINVSNTIHDKAGHACSYNPDLIYFTGRSDGMIRLLDSLNPCGKNNTVKIMGGDTLYQLAIAPNAGYPPYSYERLYYTSFAFPDEWEISGLGQFKPSFFDDYPKYFDPDHRYTNQPTYGHTLADGHVILVYDAMITLLTGIMSTVKNTKMLPFKLESLRSALANIHGSQAIQGASGCIDFGSAPNGDPINKTIVMLHVDEHGNTVLVPDGIIGCLKK